MKNFDVVVVGAGPGGYVAAIRAAQNGYQTAIVEKDNRLGGTCLLRGCIPTKSLLQSASLYRQCKNAESHGITVSGVGFDFAKIHQKRHQVVDKSAAGVAYLMRKNNIAVIDGMATLHQHDRLRVGDEEIAAKFIILATGSTPRTLQQVPIDGKKILTSDEILTQTTLPASLMVVGGGAVGVEFASVYARLGVKVSLVEAAAQLLPLEDSDIAAAFGKAYEKQSIECLLGTQLQQVTHQGNLLNVHLRQHQKTWSQTCEQLLLAIGRKPSSTDLGLEQVGIQVDDGGYIQVNQFMQTNLPNVYAIGDVVRTPWLAHVASSEGILAADHLAGKAVLPLNYQQTPSCVYADPEVASIGLSEAKAKSLYPQVRCGTFPFAALAKARILNDTTGFIKIVSEPVYGEILGVHMIGPHVTELLGEAGIAMRLECTTEELAHTVHAHPTLSEAILEAAHITLGQPIHF